MKKTEALKELAALGTAQNRKVYGRHGVQGAMYGVSYANLGKLKRQIRTDHALAEALWGSGNHDARVLATMIADPALVAASTLDAWLEGCDYAILADAVAGVAAKSPHAVKKLQKWTKAKGEWKSAAGWTVLAHVAASDDGLPDALFEGYVATIEERIRSAPNRTRYAMNNALIAIGGRNANLEKRAVAAAKRIGKVEVNHGETSCKTPDAASYIRKVRARAKAKSAAR